MKTKKKNSLKRTSLVEPFIRTLNFWTESVFIYMHQKARTRFHISYLLYIKARLKKCFSPSFPKK